MDRALSALYRRVGRIYPLLFLLFAMVEALGFTFGVVYIGIDRYLGLHAAFGHIFRVALIGVEAGTVVGTAGAMYASRSAIRWMMGRRSPEFAGAAWHDAIREPALHWPIAAPPICLGALPALVAVNNLGHPAVYAIAAVGAATLVAIALAVALHQVATETLLRPVLTEIDATNPQTSIDAGVRRRSLRLRIVGSSVLVVWISAWIASGLLSHTSDAFVQLTLTILSGAAVSLTFGLVFTLALSQSVFVPLRDLREATKRVQQGDLTTRLRVVSNDELGQVSASFNDMVIGLSERAALHAALGTYLDPSVADRLLSEGQVLRGEAVDASVLFCDIVGFTTRAERMRPDEVVAELNEFFELVIPVIETYGGHTNKLLGDGFMAVFGAPIPLTDHADRAVAAACDIQEKLWTTYAGDIRAGVGINSGTAVVGTTGGGRKLDYTVIGDTVNVASRVEALTRTTGDTILLTEATKDALLRSASLDPRGSVAIRGREELTPLYSVVVRSRG